MRVDVAQPSGAPLAPAIKPPARRSRRLDPLEAVVFGVFAAVSLWVLGLDLWQVIVNGREWTGTDGVYIVDQLQYLAWIRSASDHLLASNMFVLRSHARRLLPARGGDLRWTVRAGDRALADAAAVEADRGRSVLLRGARLRSPDAGGSPAAAGRDRAGAVLRLIHGRVTASVSVIGDLFPGFLSWGYAFGLLALAGDGRARCSSTTALRPQRDAHPWALPVPGLIGAGTSLAAPLARRAPDPDRCSARSCCMVGVARRRPRHLALPALTLVLTGRRCCTTSCSGTPICPGSWRASPAATRFRCGRSCSRSCRCWSRRGWPTASARAASWAPPRAPGRWRALVVFAVSASRASAPPRCTPSRGSRCRWPCSRSRGCSGPTGGGCLSPAVAGGRRGGGGPPCRRRSTS